MTPFANEVVLPMSPLLCDWRTPYRLEPCILFLHGFYSCLCSRFRKRHAHVKLAAIQQTMGHANGQVPCKFHVGLHIIHLKSMWLKLRHDGCLCISCSLQAFMISVLAWAL